MYRHGLSILVEDDDLKKPTGSVGTNVEVTIALVEHADGVSYRVLNVEVSDTVLARVVGDLHVCRLPCLTWLTNRARSGSPPAHRPG